VRKVSTVKITNLELNKKAVNVLIGYLATVTNCYLVKQLLVSLVLKLNLWMMQDLIHLTASSMPATVLLSET